MRDPVKNKVFKLLVCQVSIAVLMTIIAWIVYGGVAAYSVLLGGAITLISSLAFFLLALIYRTAREAGAMVRNVMLGELLKFLVMGILFFLIIKFIPVNHLALLASFIVTQLLSILVPQSAYHRKERADLTLPKTKGASHG